MTLQFLRHADAEPFTGSDFSRNLTPKGNTQAANVGKFLKSRHLVPDIILTSPLVRARQTAGTTSGNCHVKHDGPNSDDLSNNWK
jgi:phosphohistidine phosphatase